MLDRGFKTALSDRFESWELAEFLNISVEDFIEMFEDDIENCYDELAEWIGLRGKDEDDE